MRLANNNDLNILAHGAVRLCKSIIVNRRAGARRLNEAPLDISGGRAKNELKNELELFWY